MNHAPVSNSRYGFAGSGLALLGVEIVSSLLGLLTCGIGFILGVPAARRRLWLATNATRDGACFRYESSLGDALGLALVNLVLFFVTFGFATPWIVARVHAFRAAHTLTADGRRLRFDGSGTEVLGLSLLTLFALPLTGGLALPWIAVEWRRWAVNHTLIEDPSHPSGLVRLRFDGSALGMLVQFLLGMTLTLLTLGLYLPWARVNFERWAWSATTDAHGPKLTVALGPRTPAEWAVAGVFGTATLGTIAAVALLAFTASGHSLRAARSAPPTETSVMAPVFNRPQFVARDHASPSGCVVTSGPHAVARRASVASLELLARDGRIGLGWVSPGHRNRSGGTGDDDGASVELRADGTLAQTLDPEDPGREGMQFARNIEHVFALPARDGITTRIDEMQSGEGGASVACGGVRGALWSIGVDDNGLSETCVLGDMYDCRTVPTADPFVLGVVSPVDVSDGSPFASLVALRSGEPRSAAPAWTLPLHRVRRANCPVRALRSAQGVEGVTGASVASGETAVAFRWHDALYVGWLDATLRPRGPLRRVTTLGGEVGRPRMASNGREVLLVFADRERTPPRVRHMPAPEAPDYRLHALIATPDTMREPTRVDTTLSPAYDEFAPSVAPLADGTWLVVWSQGERHPRGQDAPLQRVFLRRYRADLSAVGAELELSPATPASDARVVTVGNDFVVALAVGRGSARQGFTLAGRCVTP